MTEPGDEGEDGDDVDDIKEMCDENTYFPSQNCTYFLYKPFKITGLFWLIYSITSILRKWSYISLHTCSVLHRQASSSHNQSSFVLVSDCETSAATL